MYTLIVIHTPQKTDNGPLFAKSETSAVLPNEVGEEILRLKLEELDPKALMDVVWRTP